MSECFHLDFICVISGQKIRDRLSAYFVLIFDPIP